MPQVLEQSSPSQTDGTPDIASWMDDANAALRETTASGARSEQVEWKDYRKSWAS